MTSRDPKVRSAILATAWLLGFFLLETFFYDKTDIMWRKAPNSRAE